MTIVSPWQSGPKHWGHLGAGEGRGANNGPREKGIVASRCKIQRGQTQGPGGPTSGAWGGGQPWKRAMIVSLISKTKGHFPIKLSFVIATNVTLFWFSIVGGDKSIYFYLL